MTVISFATGKPISCVEEAPVFCDEAVFEILSWDDPVMRDYTRESGRVSVDGLVPPAIAERMKALCEEWNASRESGA